MIQLCKLHQQRSLLGEWTIQYTHVLYSLVDEEKTNSDVLNA